MTAPVAELQSMRNATAAFVAGLEAEKWSDADLREPSLLPGWTRAHVLSHVEQNADRTAATLAGALSGELIARYPDGPTGRSAAIEAGAVRSASELLAETKHSAERLERVLAAVNEAGAWDAMTSENRRAWEWPVRRWQEVEIHRVDLAGAFTADQWSADFVTAHLAALCESAAERSAQPLHIEVGGGTSIAPSLDGTAWDVGAGDGPRADVVAPDWALLAWLLGRANAAVDALPDPPELAPWR
jgi:maleylpyruvate isomerase